MASLGLRRRSTNMKYTMEGGGTRAEDDMAKMPMGGDKKQQGKGEKPRMNKA